MKDETSPRNNAWFTILLSKRSGFSDYYQRCKMKHHRGIMHGLLYYYQRGQVLVIIIKDVNETSPRNNAWFTILLSKKSGFSDYYQR